MPPGRGKGAENSFIVDRCTTAIAHHIVQRYLADRW
jgi:hypothetical protein